MCSICCKHFQVLSSFITYHRVCNWSNMTSATCGAGTAYPFGAPEFIPSFQWGLSSLIFSFLCSVLQIVVSFFFCSLCCLSFDLQIHLQTLLIYQLSHVNVLVYFVDINTTVCCKIRTHKMLPFVFFNSTKTAICNGKH